jgi:Ni2+-binding GTPase involved in maturation of urease and hydrogenase
MRGGKPYVMTNLRNQSGVETIVKFIETQGLFK